jgi:TonB family protein
MNSILLERVKAGLVALTVATVVSAYPGVGAAGFGTGARQDKRPPVTMPVQVDNDPQLPVVITEATVEVGEPFDITARFNPFSQPPRMARMLNFTLKLKNQGDRPVTGLMLAIHSPLFRGSGSGFQGKDGSLGRDEEVVETFGLSVDDLVDILDLVPKMRVKPLEVSYDEVSYDESDKPSDRLRQLSERLRQHFLSGAQHLGSDMTIVEVMFHKIKAFTAKGDRPKGDTGINRLIRAEPPKHDPHADRMQDVMESVYEMSEALRPTILYKEKAEYTPEARANKARGTVVLNVIFGADGSIRVLRVVRGLPHGLTGQALKAAQRVQFEPAVKDGKPVDVRGDLEFSFDLDQ